MPVGDPRWREGEMTLHTAATGRRAPGGTAAGRAHEAGAYLTDGVFLFRVVSVVATREGEIVELEDCYGLDVVAVPLDDLHARRLRVVTPAGASLSRA
jgi:hypothetical protein